MGLKDIKDYSAEEVGLWLTAQGLGDDAPKFVEEGVDGDLLLSLTVDDLKADLGLSGLQAKKVMKNIQFSKDMTAAASGGGDEAEKLKEEVKAITGDKATLEEKVQALEDAMNAKDSEIAQLTSEMRAMKVESEKAQAQALARAPPPQPAPAPAPAHKSAPAPAPAPAPHRRRGRGVVGGAATGAAGGAMKGAIAGAILPGMDASDGAKAGAAVGATSGGLRGLRGRRRG
mmetsp:Transcript_33201/g.69873  ORF Transcript_33201/g.69873 Transcript_33201/m.69873 type:complete len:230 (+) Transcript_33201:83-772(+)|eukprot:CAMPEP_0172298062 /NCGR_PEP_ID=MMETSP1058-20130122/873_1 /TAXON_ID=83371 /ORGANISM="Detonula confervacea, Strain CCMP 353" /LENGTH=229 /DNA_ID=CAMNT_0013007297 /DNA_START=22 /DNA_END=711 /DNA_ORIENTATION=-